MNLKLNLEKESIQNDLGSENEFRDSSDTLWECQEQNASFALDGMGRLTCAAPEFCL